jgi:cobalt/nickel transport system permease protein
LFQVGRLDRLARQDTPVHRLDPRAKIIVVLVFLLCVVSFHKYELARLLPFTVFPLALAGAGRVPMDFLLKRLLIVAPFAILVGMFNPLLDQEVLLRLGGLEVSGGWISFLSIIMRFVLTISTALVLIAVTSFDDLCRGLQRMGVPTVFTVQLLFLYRYIWLLADEAIRLVRARALRSFGGRGMEFKVYASLVGNLLLRTLDRARRIHMAMACRGFTGEIQTLRKFHGGSREALFVASWFSLFAILRLWDVPGILGDLVMRLAG